MRHQMLCLLLTACAAPRFDSNENERAVTPPFDFTITITPPVGQPVTERQDITFQPGDRIWIDAGGCVQTGGSGPTWKRYVDPSGEAADRLYHGLVFIPGVTPGLVRIGGLVGRALDVPTTGTPTWGVYLTLGYEDSTGGYGDNGYYSHDDGTENQCQGVGAAWITIRVKHGVNGAPGSANTTGVLPFDLKWASTDPNGFPFNPSWFYATPTTTAVADPEPQCNGFAWTQMGVDPGASCTSLKPANDSLGYWKDFVPTLCENDKRIRGHVNFGEVTMQGSVTFTKFDPPEPNGDDDVNMALEGMSIAQAPLAPLNHQSSDPAGVGNIVLEFDSDETTDHFQTVDWWRRFQSTPTMADHQMAVVTGLVGFDVTHGFSTEIHPVHAIAMSTGEHRDAFGNITEEWGYFVRSFGDEGECAQEDHFTALPNNDFLFRIPWKPGMGSFDFFRGDSQRSATAISGPWSGIIRDAQGVPQAARVEFDGFPPAEQRPWVAGSFSMQWHPCSSDLTIDANNCGACFHACVGSTPVCSNSQCACSNHLQTDPNHCGTCANQCASGLCAGGQCVCPAGQTMCGGVCVDTSADASNCGQCGAYCPGTCQAGSCHCPSGTTFCGLGYCVDLSSNSYHCGSCTHSCNGHDCVGGVCQPSCPPDMPLRCGLTCVDPQTDGANCGHCGRRCTTGNWCNAGQCVRGTPM